MIFKKVETTNKKCIDINIFEAVKDLSELDQGKDKQIEILITLKARYPQRQKLALLIDDFAEKHNLGKLTSNSYDHIHRKEKALIQVNSKPKTEKIFNWDETIALDGKIGDYLVMARKLADTWYVGGMTDWDARSITVDFSFLKKGKYKANIFQDGINADRIGNDYKKLETTIEGESTREFKLAPGGGFVIKIEPL